MLLPNSKAHSAIAPQKPSTIAATAQRSGQGKALRTAMRGALIVSRRRRSLKRIQGTAVAKLNHTAEKKAAARDLCGFSCIGCKRLL
jgi:hypothetical protein